jgi:hypothetical protein
VSGVTRDENVRQVSICRHGDRLSYSKLKYCLAIGAASGLVRAMAQDVLAE